MTTSPSTTRNFLRASIDHRMLQDQDGDVYYDDFVLNQEEVVEEEEEEVYSDDVVLNDEEVYSDDFVLNQDEAEYLARLEEEEYLATEQFDDDGGANEMRYEFFDHDDYTLQEYNEESEPFEEEEKEDWLQDSQEILALYKGAGVQKGELLMPPKVVAVVGNVQDDRSTNSNMEEEIAKQMGGGKFDPVQDANVVPNPIAAANGISNNESQKHVLVEFSWPMEDQVHQEIHEKCTVLTLSMLLAVAMLGSLVRFRCKTVRRRSAKASLPCHHK